QEKTLNDAKKCVEEAVRLNERSVDAWTTYGFILEDLAWLFHKTDLFEKACEKFEKAMTLAKRETGPIAPWLGRGRIRFRWAAAESKMPGPAPQVPKLLDSARSDLDEVRKRSRNPVERAE